MKINALSKVIQLKDGELLANVNGESIDLSTAMFVREVLQPLARWHSEGGLYFVGNGAESTFKELLKAKGVTK
jgi:hypothetical protein